MSENKAMSEERLVKALRALGLMLPAEVHADFTAIVRGEIDRLRAENERLREAGRVLREYPPGDVLAAKLRLSRWRDGGGWDDSIYPGERNIVEAVSEDDRLVFEWEQRRTGALAALNPEPTSSASED